MDTAVLLIVFNRLNAVQQVFDAVRQAKPKRLYISADGPRMHREGEVARCTEVRDWLVSHVDWNCEMKTRFLERNIGCGLGPSTAISWFFETEKQGIILEDDCVPHQDFFEFAAQMLVKYQEDDSIMAINSSNFQTAPVGSGSYYFSMQNGPFCAWATWKRSWETFDYSLKRYPKATIEFALNKYYKVTKREKMWWLKIYDDLVNNDVYHGSSWDYQYIFAFWANRGKTIVPNVNLSTNIGFGPEATHTHDADDVTANRPMQSILPLKYSCSEAISREADLYYHDFYYERFVDHTPWWKKMKRKIKKAILKN